MLLRKISRKFNLSSRSRETRLEIPLGHQWQIKMLLGKWKSLKVPSEKISGNFRTGTLCRAQRWLWRIKFAHKIAKDIQNVAFYSDMLIEMDDVNMIYTNSHIWNSFSMFLTTVGSMPFIQPCTSDVAPVTTQGGQCKINQILCSWKKCWLW